ncbi:MAG: hydrogenase maturation protease [Gaiellaceae bacterium]
MTRDARPLVVGIGNDWRRDDGAGLAVARGLDKEAGSRALVLEQNGDLNALLDALEGVDLALIVDSTSSSAEPGSIRRLDPSVDDLTDALPRTSSHALGLAEALELARTLDRLPGRVVVYGIEGESFAVGSGLSPSVASAVAAVVAAIREELDQLTHPDASEAQQCTSKR